MKILNPAALTINKIHAFFNPEEFRGWGKRRRYFEGWYYKIVNDDESRAFAIIPGVAMDEKGNRQAFIQVLDGKRKTAEYHRFDFSDFKPASRAFELSIGPNWFSGSRIRLDLPGLRGELFFSGNIPWPKPFYSPGIMGPYSFAPFMECYHGIVSMDHTVKGSLEYKEELIGFGKGRGYIEKDWGQSFPSAYFWLQTNHFSETGISLKASVAKIPWIRGSFTGFIAGLWLKDRLIRFTTYNGSVLKRSFANENRVELVLENRAFRLEINTRRDGATTLASPISGLMDGRIEESMTSRIHTRLLDKKKQILLLDDTGRNGGLEVAGAIKEIMTG